MNDLTKILPQPERHLIGARSEYLAAVDALLAGPCRELRVFDPDCAQLELNAPARADSLRRFLLTGRDQRLLVAEFSGSIAIHQTEGQAARAQDCFVLVDMEHFVRRPVAAAWRGVYARNEPQEARLIRERYDEIWQSSVPAVSATSLGL
jgi:hypothetical protein